MDLFEYYKTNKTVEAEGVWIPYPHVKAKVKLARAGGSNKQWEVERERVLRPLRKAYRGETIPDTETLDALLTPFCKLIIKDWEVKKDGKTVPCTMENKIKLCQELPDFYVEMMTDAGTLDYYRAAENEVDAGKLESGSGGSKPTETPEE